MNERLDPPDPDRDLPGWDDLRDFDDLPPRGTVEDFFARERATIQEMPGHDLHWQGIVRSAREKPRRQRAAWAAAGVAAAVAMTAGVVVWQGQQTPGDLDPAGGGATSASTSEPSPPETALPEPSDGPAVAGLANGLDGNRAALSSTECGDGGTCPRVLTSTDGGRSWLATAAIEGIEPAPRTGTIPGAADGPDQVGFVAFATPEFGVVAGSRTLVTSESGNSWADLDGVEGTAVHLQSVPEEGAIELATMSECDQDACSGTLRLYRITPETGQASAFFSLDDVADFTGLSWSQAGEGEIVVIDSADSHVAYRVAGGTATRVEPCAQDGTADVASAPDGTTLTAICQTTDEDGTRITTTRSGDAGQTWSAPSAATQVAGRVTGVAQLDGQRLVLVTDADSEAVYTSGDAGHGWSVLTGEHAPAGPFVSVDANDMGRVVAVRANSTSYAESVDGGASWNEIGVSAT